MRGELTIPAAQLRSQHSAENILPIVCFCTIGLLMTFTFALCEPGLDQLPLLIAQYNVFG
jgi:hypothetical protein